MSHDCDCTLIINAETAPRTVTTVIDCSLYRQLLSFFFESRRSREDGQQGPRFRSRCGREEDPCSRPPPGPFASTLWFVLDQVLDSEDIKLLKSFVKHTKPNCDATAVQLNPARRASGHTTTTSKRPRKSSLGLLRPSTRREVIPGARSYHAIQPPPSSGIKESDTGLANPSIWDLVADKQVPYL